MADYGKGGYDKLGSTPLPADQQGTGTGPQQGALGAEFGIVEHKQNQSSGGNANKVDGVNTPKS